MPEDLRTAPRDENMLSLQFCEFQNKASLNAPPLSGWRLRNDPSSSANESLSLFAHFPIFFRRGEKMDEIFSRDQFTFCTRSKLESAGGMEVRIIDFRGNSLTKTKN